MGLLTFLALALSTPSHADVPKASYKLNLEEYSINMVDYRFPSGLRMIFQAEHAQPVVAITSVIDSGSERDQSGYEGIAHVIEHLNFRAKHGDLPKNWDMIDELGGMVNASTSNDWTNYMVVAPADSTVPLLRLEALRLKKAVENVTEGEVKTESEIARNEFRQNHESAAYGAAFDSLAPMLFPEGHDYRRSTIGSHESLGRLDLAHVQEYVDKYYVPKDATIVVVGDLQLDQSWPLILQAFDADLDLLMAPEDAAAYRALPNENARVKFLETWVPKLQSYLKENGSKPFPARADCSARQEPPPPTSQGPAYVRGKVDETVVLLAWTLPGAYCEDESVLYGAAEVLQNVIFLDLFPMWEYAKQDGPLEGLGCFVDGGQQLSTMVCYIEAKASADYTPEQLVERAANTLYMQWDLTQLRPDLRSFMDWSYGNVQNQYMIDVLDSADVVADLFGGRATTNAMTTHFTGDPAYFSRSIGQVKQVSMENVRNLALKYLTRDRMVSAIVDPLDEQERLKLEAQAAASSRSEEVKEYSATQGADRYRRLFQAEDLTPEAIERVAIAPDRSKIRELTLENGLKVAIMSYGEAPVTRVKLEVFGTEGSAPKRGLDTLGEELYSAGNTSVDRLMGVAGYGGRFPGIIEVQGSSGNLDALLNKVRWYAQDYDWEFAEKKTRAKDFIKLYNRMARQPDYWAEKLSLERLFPNHPAGVSIGTPDIRAAMEYESDDFKNWIYRKWQPANAQLVIVGKVNVDEAEQAVRKFMGGWAKEPGVEEGKIPDWPKPTQKPDRQVLIFDAPEYTQTQVDLVCQLERTTEQDNAKAYVVADVLSEMAWRKLREEAGITYGAGAYPVLYKGGTAFMGMSSLVQNDGAGFAVATMFDLIQLGAKGEIDPDAVASHKWSIARKWGLNQQSSDQMANRLLNTGVGTFDYFDYFPKTLGAVQVSDFAQVMAPCGGHEVVTMVGPKSVLEPQLKEKGIAYEIVDWQATYLATLTKKDIKAYDKWKKALDERVARANASQAATASK